jgi:hypothetical protein
MILKAASLLDRHMRTFRITRPTHAGENGIRLTDKICTIISPGGGM